MSRSKRRRKEKFVSSPEISRLHPMTESQGFLIDSIRENTVTIASGAAGVGKTLLALHSAVWMHHRGDVDKILYVKPNIDNYGEKELPTLPGELDEKLAPLLFPVIDNLAVFCTDGKAKSLIHQKKIEGTLLGYMRGRSLNRTFVILDEAQNTTPHWVKTMISRIGQDSKLVILGDPSQKDTGGFENGILDATNRLKGLDNVGMIFFNHQDNVRNPDLIELLERY